MICFATTSSAKLAAGGLVVAAFVSSALPTSGKSPSALLGCVFNRNPSLVSYTFNMDVAMRMRHFPWLRFHMSGPGRYARGRAYRVTFTHMPPFARGYQTVDLAPLDPSLWRKLYRVHLVEKNGGMMTFALTPRTVDPQQQNPLTVAYVTLDSGYSTRKADMRYKKGDIQLTDTLGRVQGYRLPSTGDVSIDMPGNDLDAHATFSDYAITRQAGNRQKVLSAWRRPCEAVALRKP